MANYTNAMRDAKCVMIQLGIYDDDDKKAIEMANGIYLAECVAEQLRSIGFDVIKRIDKALEKERDS